MELINSFLHLLPLIVFLVVFVGSLPFVGMIIPEELVLTLGFIFSQNFKTSITIFLLSIIAMFASQMLVYYFAKKYGIGILSKLKIKKKHIKKVSNFSKHANFFDHVLLRISANSMFRVTAAFVTGLNKTTIQKQLQYEFVASVLKTSLYFFVAMPLSTNISEENIKQLLATVTITIFAVTILSIATSFVIKRRIKTSN